MDDHEKGIGINDLPELLAANDGMAHRVIRETGKWIGMGIMQIIRVLDPCEIIFKGYLATALWPYLQPHIVRSYIAMSVKCRCRSPRWGITSVW